VSYAQYNTSNISDLVAIQQLWGYLVEFLPVTFAKLQLLPGNFVKLQSRANQDMIDGLEIHVELCGEWKQVLIELSGGQRSARLIIVLLAIVSYLSFMCMCKGPSSWYR
jgi:hypothetical protein